jgi:hypothetical protein
VFKEELIGVPTVSGAAFRRFIAPLLTPRSRFVVQWRANGVGRRNREETNKGDEQD